MYRLYCITYITHTTIPGPMHLRASPHSRGRSAASDAARPMRKPQAALLGGTRARIRRGRACRRIIGGVASCL